MDPEFLCEAWNSQIALGKLEKGPLYFQILSAFLVFLYYSRYLQPQPGRGPPLRTEGHRS